MNDSAQLPICDNLEDEICNGGPLAWKKLIATFRSCPRPCKIISYIHSKVEIYQSDYVDNNPNKVHLALTPNKIKRIETEILVYDVTDMIGALGGSLGLFLGFSFLGLLSDLIDFLQSKLEQVQNHFPTS